MDCEIDFLDNDDSADHKGGSKRPFFKKKAIQKSKQGKQ